MTIRRVTVFCLLACLLAPAAQAADLGEPSSRLPEWVLDSVQPIRDSIGSESPDKTSQNVAPIVTPTG